MRNVIKEMIINSFIENGIFDGKCKIEKAINVRHSFEHTYEYLKNYYRGKNFNTSQIICKTKEGIYIITVSKADKLMEDKIVYEDIEQTYTEKNGIEKKKLIL